MRIELRYSYIPFKIRRLPDEQVAGHCLLALPVLAASSALAHVYPSKPVRWVVPYPAGGGSGFLARTIGQHWSTAASQPVLIDNKPGGNTAIGASDVARAPPMATQSFRPTTARWYSTQRSISR